MNIRTLKEKLVITIIGLAIVSLWVFYSLLTGFNWYAFITNPSVLSILLILIVPLSFLVADLLWRDK
jgi:hypothetical protein